MQTITPQPTPPDAASAKIKYLLTGLTGIALWFALYWQLHRLAEFLTFSLLGLKPGSHLGESVLFFFYDTPKVLMLLTLIVFAVGILRSFFTPERTRKTLAGKSESVGNVLAALLGIVTPFCSCSAVPLFIGFVTAGVCASSPPSARSWRQSCATWSRPLSRARATARNRSTRSCPVLPGSAFPACPAGCPRNTLPDQPPHARDRPGHKPERQMLPGYQ